MSRSLTPDALQRHADQSRTWAQRAHADGRCVGCGQPHTTPGRRLGTLAHRCETCRVAARQRARQAWRVKVGRAA